MSLERTYEDAFNLLCGKLIGEGIHRRVFECRIRPDCVVKVESDPLRYFANVMENKFWSDHFHCPAVKRWLAPIEYLSPDARLMLMKRAEPIRETDKLPDKLPAFLSDRKRANFGFIDGQLVAVDYALSITKASTRMGKANWTDRARS